MGPGGDARPPAIDAVLAGPQPLDGQTLININVPVLDGAAEPKGLRVARASMSSMVVEYRQAVSDEGLTTYQVSNSMHFARREKGTDVEALYEKYITITPLHFDTTCPDRTAAWGEQLHRAEGGPVNGETLGG